MSTITKTLHLYVKAPRYGTSPEMWVSESKSLPLDTFGRVAASTEATFEMPDNLNLFQLAIEELEAEKAAAAEEFRRKVADINDRLSKLQAITMTTEPA